MSEKTKIKLDIYEYSGSRIVSVELEPNSTIFDLTNEVAKKLIATSVKEWPAFKLFYNYILINTTENRDKTINSFGINSSSRVSVAFAVPCTSLLSWETIGFKSENKSRIKHEDKSNEISMLSQDLLFSKTTEFELTNETKVESENRRKIELKNENNWPLLRIIIGVIDLLSLFATITTFLLFFLTSLNLSIAVPIVLTFLFFVGAALFFGFGKIFPKSWTETPEFTAGNNIDKQNNGITRDERQNMADIEEITVYVKDISQNGVELKLKPYATFEDLLIALKKSKCPGGSMNLASHFDLCFKGKHLHERLKDLDLKQVKINDLNIQDHSTLTFIGYLCSTDDAYFSWANIKNVDEKDLTDGWMKKPNSTRVTIFDLVDVNRVVGQKVTISLDER